MFQWMKGASSEILWWAETMLSQNVSRKNSLTLRYPDTLGYRYSTADFFFKLAEIDIPIKVRPSLKWKCNFAEIFITGYIGRCHNDNVRCSLWWNFRQKDISGGVRYGVCFECDVWPWLYDSTIFAIMLYGVSSYIDYGYKGILLYSTLDGFNFEQVDSSSIPVL